MKLIVEKTMKVRIEDKRWDELADTELSNLADAISGIIEQHFATVIKAVQREAGEDVEVTHD